MDTGTQIAKIMERTQVEFQAKFRVKLQAKLTAKFQAEAQTAFQAKPQCVFQTEFQAKPQGMFQTEFHAEFPMQTPEQDENVFQGLQNKSPFVQAPQSEPISLTPHSKPIQQLLPSVDSNPLKTQFPSPTNL